MRRVCCPRESITSAQAKLPVLNSVDALSSCKIGAESVTSRAHTLARIVREAFRSGTGMPYANYIAGGDAQQIATVTVGFERADEQLAVGAADVRIADQHRVPTGMTRLEKRRRLIQQATADFDVVSPRP